MRCENVSTELAARSRDDDPTDDPDLMAHLERCPDCAEHERTLAPIRNLWREARENEIDPGVDAWSRLRARIEEESRPRRHSRLLLVIPALAAAAALLLFALLVEPAQNDALSVELLYGRLLIDGAPATPGRTVRVETGRAIANPGETPARVDLDGATFVLAPGAAVAWISEREFELRSGTTLVRASRPLSVAAGGVRAEVLGTEFVLDRTGRGLGVHVLEGRVRMTGAGSPVDVPRGARSFCPEGGVPEAPTHTSAWPALDWIGSPRLHLDVLSEADREAIDLAIRIDTTAREEIPLRPFTAGSADFLLEIEDSEGRRFPLKILPGMVVETSRPRGHRALFSLVHGHPYELRIRLRPSDLGEVPGTYTVVASYNVRGPSGERLWQGRLTSEPRRIRR